MLMIQHINQHSNIIQNSLFIYQSKLINLDRKEPNDFHAFLCINLMGDK